MEMERQKSDGSFLLVTVSILIFALAGGLYYFFFYDRMEDPARTYYAAAEKGDAEAQFSLGKCYFRGEGVKEDKAEAVKWFRKSAEQDNAKAQNNLGLCYYEGEGVKKDKTEARIWLEKATAQGDIYAVDLLKEIK